MFATNNFNLSETSQSVVVFLGAPMSGGQHLNIILHGKKEELLLLTKILELMPSHDSLFLLRNVLAAPRLMYLLRTSLCTDSPELPLYDSVLRNSHWWLQASLPVRWVGLGVRGIVLLAPSAYLTSAASTMEQLRPPF